MQYIAVGSSVLQDVTKHSRIISCSHAPSYLLLCIVQESARRCTGEEVVWLRETNLWVDLMSDVYLSV